MNGKKAKALRRAARDATKDSQVAWNARGRRIVKHQFKGAVARIELHPASGRRLYKCLKRQWN